MPYATDVADHLAQQLSRFITLNPHQLAGQVANLNFWLDEVRHALGALDGYAERFRRLKAAQDAYVEAHNTRAFHPGPVGRIDGRPPPPTRAPHTAFQEARQGLCEAVYRLIIRCVRVNLLEYAAARKICADLGIGVDPLDFRDGRR